MIDKKAMKYNEEKIEIFNKICEPLFKNFGLTNFWYARLYSDGSISDITNDLPWKRHVWENNYFTFGDSMSKLFFNLEEGAIIKVLPPVNHSDSTVEAARAFGVYNLYTILVKRSSYIESIGFGTSCNYNNIHSLYTSLDNSLGLFYNSFLISAKELIINTPRVNFSFPISRSLPSFFCEKEIDQFLKDINYDKYSLEFPGNIITFTKREMEILLHLSYGKTYKEIARDIKISPRTAETYLLNIRKKAGGVSRSSLVKAFLKSRITNTFT